MSLQHLDSNEFDRTIYDNGETCLVVFSRQNCHVCKEVVPMLEELAPQYEGKFGFYYVDVEIDTNLTQRFPLKGIPSILFFKDGTPRGKLAGLVETEQVEEKIAEVADE
jgi:thioredoxin 1